MSESCHEARLQPLFEMKIPLKKFPHGKIILLINLLHSVPCLMSGLAVYFPALMKMPIYFLQLEHHC
jgi:hypothetical protein